MSLISSRRHFCSQLMGVSALAALAPGSALAAKVALVNAQKPSTLSMLAQRCAKAYAQTAMNVLPEQSKSVLQQSQRSMTSSLSQLRGQPPEMRFELQRELRRFDALLSAAPARKILLAVSHQSNVLQDAVERDTAPDAFHALATLSQRMAKNYFLLAYGLDQADARVQLFLDQRAFKLALQTSLQGTQQHKQSALRALELVQGQWAFYEAALKTPANANMEQQVATASERIWALLWPCCAA